MLQIINWNESHQNQMLWHLLVQEKSKESVKLQKKNSSCPPKKEVEVKNKPKKNEKKLCKGGKKPMPPINWPHLLGC